MKGRDKVYLDILRIIAIFLVVYNHTPGFYLPPYSNWSDMGYYSMLLQSEITKMAVPLFLMVSGALLLHKEESILELFKKRILRFVAVLLIIALIQYSLYCHWEKEGVFDIHFFISKLYSGSIGWNKFHANWFLFAYLGILLLLPLLRITAKGISHRVFIYLLGLQTILCCIIPLISMIGLDNYVEFSGINRWFPFQPYTRALPFSYGYVIFYVLMGYYIEHLFPMEIWQKHKAKLITLAIGCLVAGVACMEIARHYQDVKQLHQAVIYLSSFLPIPCAVVYMWFKGECSGSGLSPIKKKIIGALGGAVFTVMLVENLFRIKWDGIYKTLLPEINRVPAALVYTAAIWAAGLLVGLVLKRIPFVKRIF